MRDIFIVHTKSLPLDLAVVDRLARVLVEAGFTVVGYNEWEWEKVTKSYDWRDELMSTGSVPFEDTLNDPLPPRREVNQANLDETISLVRAVLFLYPSRRELTDGMSHELASLRRLARTRRSDLALLWCCFAMNNREPFPVEGATWLGQTILNIREAPPNEVAVWDLAIRLATVLLTHAMRSPQPRRLAIRDTTMSYRLLEATAQTFRTLPAEARMELTNDFVALNSLLSKRR